MFKLVVRGQLLALLCFFDSEQILAKEIEIIYELAQTVLQYETTLIEASDICAEIDR